MKIVAGQTHRVEIDPRAYYFDTGLDVDRGESYSLIAKGMWRDASRTVNALGWSDGMMARFSGLNRLSDRNFFLMCGSVGKEKPFFEIGERLEGWRPRTAGRLYAFANDVIGFYWNNRVAMPNEGGPMLLTVTRIL